MEIKNLTETEEIILKGANRTHNKCRCCGQIKPIDEFCTDKRNSCGHNTLCRECKKEQDREYHKKLWQIQLDTQKKMQNVESGRKII